MSWYRLWPGLWLMAGGCVLLRGCDAVPDFFPAPPDFLEAPPKPPWITYDLDCDHSGVVTIQKSLFGAAAPTTDKSDSITMATVTSYTLHESTKRSGIRTHLTELNNVTDSSDVTPMTTEQSQPSIDHDGDTLPVLLLMLLALGGVVIALCVVYLRRRYIKYKINPDAAPRNVAFERHPRLLPWERSITGSGQEPNSVQESLIHRTESAPCSLATDSGDTCYTETTLRLYRKAEKDRLANSSDSSGIGLSQGDIREQTNQLFPGRPSLHSNNPDPPPDVVKTTVGNGCYAGRARGSLPILDTMEKVTPSRKRNLPDPKDSLKPEAEVSFASSQFIHALPKPVKNLLDSFLSEQKLRKESREYKKRLRQKIKEEEGQGSRNMADTALYQLRKSLTRCTGDSTPESNA